PARTACPLGGSSEWKGVLVRLPVSPFLLLAPAGGVLRVVFRASCGARRSRCPEGVRALHLGLAAPPGAAPRAGDLPRGRGWRGGGARLGVGAVLPAG